MMVIFDTTVGFLLFAIFVWLWGFGAGFGAGYITGRDADPEQEKK